MPCSTPTTILGFCGTWEIKKRTYPQMTLRTNGATVRSLQYSFGCQWSLSISTSWDGNRTSGEWRKRESKWLFLSRIDTPRFFKSRVLSRWRAMCHIPIRHAWWRGNFGSGHWSHNWNDFKVNDDVSHVTADCPYIFKSRTVFPISSIL